MKRLSLLKKQGKRFLASVLLLALVFSTGAHVGLFPNKVMAAAGEVDEEVTTYHDYYDMTGKVETFLPNSSSDWRYHTLTSELDNVNTNEAIRFRYKVGDAPTNLVNDGVGFARLHMYCTGPVGTNGYRIDLKPDAIDRIEVSFYKNDVHQARWYHSGAALAKNTELEIEMGVIRVKHPETNELVARKVYLKINGISMSLDGGVNAWTDYAPEEVTLGTYARALFYPGYGDTRYDVTLSSMKKKLNTVADATVTGGETAPDTVTGHQFAGYYTTYTKDEQVPVAKGQTVDTATTPVYAKYIPDDVLTIKAQNGTVDGEKVVRFVSTVDSLHYKSVGFKMQLANAGGIFLPNSTGSSVVDVSSSKVFKTLRTIGDTTVVPTEFSASSEYFFACTFHEIPSYYDGGKIYITPYYVTQDGTTVEGDEVTFTIANGGVQ